MREGDIASFEDLHRWDFPEVAIVLKELVEDLDGRLEFILCDELAKGDQELFWDGIGEEVAGLQVRVLCCEDVDLGEESGADVGLRGGNVFRHWQSCVEVEQQRWIVVRARGCQGDVEPGEVVFHYGNVMEVYNADIDMGSCIFVD